MAVEIERKFLVTDVSVLDGRVGVEMVQGYLTDAAATTVRVRVAGDSAWLTIKGRTHGISRSEFEYVIPVADARAMLDELTTRPPVHKTRYRLPGGALTWEVDVFHGANAGLVVAEVELAAADTPVELPAWVGAEVSDDVRYANSRLYERPFSTW